MKENPEYKARFETTIPNDEFIVNAYASFIKTL